jgi:signal transduction histidine kinase
VTARPRRSSLFRRIYGTFVITFLAAAAVVGTGGWLLARTLGAEWMSAAMERLDAENDAWVADLADPDALARRLTQLDRELGTHSAVYSLDGERVAGDGPPHTPPRMLERERRLRRGNPIVHRKGDRPFVVVPLTRGDDEVVAIVHVVPGPPRPLRVAVVVVLLLIAAFGLGAWRLSRDLTSRIGALDRSVGRIADGELAHRVAVPGVSADEIDELGGAVNDMAARLEQLVAGQRTLLANVSHELRTPIARTKVLLEILQERVEMARAAANAGQLGPLERVRTGLVEMGQDILEVEALIGDLLTSGRLELRGDLGGKGSVEAAAVDLPSLLTRTASRFGATVDVAPGLAVVGEAFLLERLLSNLLANARRACPDGAVQTSAVREGDRIVLRVQDEGPGIPPEARETVFEPFRRLDDARSRDKGGVGLGLYLCRQICRAHGGTLVARGRPDGGRGACLEASLPA